MIELKENKIYSNQQLAEWFGLKGKRFSNLKQKEKKLEQLKLFADYELVGNKTKKILIKKVFQPVYTKKGSQNYKILQDNFQNYWSDQGEGLDTAKRVGEAMYSDGIVDVTCGTAVEYSRRIKRDGWGKNYVSEGKKGYSIYAWGKYVQDGDQIKLVPLTKEEEQVKRKLVKKYFGNTTEKQVFIQGMVEEGQITKEQAWTLLEELTDMKGKFQAFKAQLSIALNSAIGRGTYLITTKVQKESAF